MTPTEQTTIGVDFRDGVYHVARVTHSQGRPSVRALTRYEPSHLSGHHLLQGGAVVLAIPDDRVIVKRLHLESSRSIEPQAQARFEMARCLLDDESEYAFDIVDTGLENRHLALAVRRRSVADEIISPFVREAGLSTKPVGLTRAVGLARGYLTFCRPHGGELVCLVDEANDLVSICFVLNQSLVGLSRLNINRYDLSSKPGRKMLAMELKTVISFQLAMFFEDRLTLPLTALLVSGGIGDEVITELARLFPITVTRPQFNAGFFAEPNEATSPSLESYLVALGLANN